MRIFDFLLYHISYLIGLKKKQIEYYYGCGTFAILLTINLLFILNLSGQETIVNNIVIDRKVLYPIISFLALLIVVYLVFNRKDKLKAKYREVKKENIILTIIYISCSIVSLIISGLLVN